MRIENHSRKVYESLVIQTYAGDKSYQIITLNDKSLILQQIGVIQTSKL